MTVKSIGILSAAKLYGALLAIIGLIIGVIYGLFIILFGAAMLSIGRDETTGAGVGSIIAGLAVMVIAPILYGVIGFIGGIFAALIYNILAKIVGGLELDLEGEQPIYSAPPQQNYGAYYQDPSRQYQPR